VPGGKSSAVKPSETMGRANSVMMIFLVVGYLDCSGKG
jgi:hypothetical protein